MTANTVSHLADMSAIALQLGRMEEKLDNQSSLFGLRLEALALEVRMLHEKQCEEMGTLAVTHEKDVTILSNTDKGLSSRFSKELSDHESRLRGLERRPMGLTGKGLWTGFTAAVAASAGLITIFTRLIGG